MPLSVKLISTSDLENRRANPIQVMKMADAFASLGQQVEVVLPGWKKSLPSQQISRRFGLKNDFRIRFIPNVSLKGKFGILTFALGVYGAGRRWDKTTVIVTRNERAAAFLAAAGKAILYENHTFYFSKASVTEKYRRRVRGLMNKKNILMVAISQRLKDLWVESGVLSEKIFVAHDGVEVDEFRRVAALAKSELRTKLGLPREKAIIGYTGSLGADRGIDLILEAAAVYNHRDYLFLILGGDPRDIERCRGRAQGLNVMFAGYIENSLVPLYLRCADLLVMPYQKNVVTIDGCSPMKVFEYLASGNPIIAPLFPSYAEVLKEFPGIFLYEPEEPGRFIALVGTVLEDADTRKPHDRLDRLVPYSWRSRAQRFLEFHARFGQNEHPSRML
jgi:glycosyltransferase involved in cell wall biosynthesis